MYNDATIAVVVPAFNEEPFIGGVLETIPDFVDQVYAVDDCSTDDTWKRIQSHARTEVKIEVTPDGGYDRNNRVVPIRHNANRGRGAAIKTGYTRALRDGMDVVVVMDGDGQMDPSQLHRLVEPVVTGQADYAKGNRLSNPSDWRGMSLWRVFGNVLLTQLTRVASGYWSMRDSQNGYTAISAEALNNIDLAGLFNRYGFLNDLLIELNIQDHRIIDVGMPAVYGDEHSGIKYSTFVPSVSFLLLSGWVKRLSKKYLMHSFHPLVIPFSLGIIGGSIAIGRRIRPVVIDIEDRGPFGLGLLSWLCLGLALLLDKWYNEYLVSSTERPDEK